MRVAVLILLGRQAQRCRARRVLIHSGALVSLPSFPIRSSEKNFVICGRFCAFVLLSTAVFL
jgi:hypothetical protein